MWPLTSLMFSRLIEGVRIVECQKISDLGLDYFNILLAFCHFKQVYLYICEDIFSDDPSVWNYKHCFDINRVLLVLVICLLILPHSRRPNLDSVFLLLVFTKHVRI